MNIKLRRYIPMAQRSKIKFNEPAARSECCHHWMIEGPVDPNSKGICNFCAAQQEFKNYLRDCLLEESSIYQHLPKESDYHVARGKTDEDIITRLRANGRI
jgi:hypothetical protein